MCHPFELEVSELETLNLEIQEITDEEAEKVSGGRDYTTLALGEGGGNFTRARAEQGGDFTTLALGEGGGNYKNHPAIKKYRCLKKYHLN